MKELRPGAMMMEMCMWTCRMCVISFALIADVFSISELRSCSV